MYETISKKLSEARHSGNPEQIKEALLFLAGSLTQLLEKKDATYDLFAPFSFDKDMLFKKDTGDFSGVGVRTMTKGLVSQLLDMIGIVEYEKISEDVSDSIFGVMADLSRNAPSDKTEKDKKELKEALEVLQLAAS
jgi:hypothetical protein